MKKPPNENKIPPSKDPTIAPITAGLLLKNASDGAFVADEDGNIVDFEVGGAEGSKLLVHIYCSLLPISSNKISLSN